MLEKSDATHIVAIDEGTFCGDWTPQRRPQVRLARRIRRSAHPSRCPVGRRCARLRKQLRHLGPLALSTQRDGVRILCSPAPPWVPGSGSSLPTIRKQAAPLKLVSSEESVMRLDRLTAAVVTGGASGLGAATARHLAALSVRVALFDLNQEAGAALAAELGGVFCKVDVTSEAASMRPSNVREPHTDRNRYSSTALAQAARSRPPAGTRQAGEFTFPARRL